MHTTMKSKRAPGLVIAGALMLVLCTTAQAEMAKTFLNTAIKNGTASGELTGPQADAWKAKTKSTAPIKVTVTTVKKFSQPDCARLAVKMTQDNVPKTDGSFGTLETGWGMNTCLDGLPPADSVDWSKTPQPAIKTKVEMSK